MSVPKLRFMEFDLPYKLTSLDDALIDYSLGGNYANSYDVTSNALIKMGNLGRGYINAEKVEYIQNNERITDDHKLEIGDLLFNTRNTLDLVGKVAIWRGELERAYFNSNIMRMVFDNNYYMNYALNTKKSLTKLKAIASGTTSVAAIYTKDLKKIKIWIPSINEQTKIADFLSSVDDKITLLNKQYDLLCQYKKGMMQKIFSQELRFKDDSGRAFPEWKSTILDEVVDLITNGLALDQNDSKNGYPVSRIETISEHCINMNKVGFVNTDNDISNYKLNYGDMLFSNINSISHIGKIAYFNIDDTLYHGMNLLRIVIKNSHCKLFFYYQLTTDTNKKYFESRANQAVSQASINQTELRKTPVQVPCQEEQTKIASFLSALDNKIAVKKAELDKLKTWKQGLLQQMFV